MSRPTTRSKNKRSRQEEDNNLTSGVLRKIYETGEVTEDDVRQLYMIWKPACQGCRVNTKDNPNCFCGLIPPPNGSRKAGLWQKMSEILQSLGPDPNQDLRASPDTPAGLTNLGATCYANSILQCLFMNRLFREGIFSVEPDVLNRQPVLYQLAKLFAQLHSSKKAFVDSAPFIKTLELDNGVQQDSHEFLTLLLSLLERCLSNSNVRKARTIVQDLFRGGVSHVTTCSKCGKDSDASSNIEDLYELELNVKGFKSLNESLDDYLNVDYLQGDNQYYCDSCDMRVDATRSIKLRMLPDVLNLQLKRYVFHQKTIMRKKISSAFSFPGELNMGPRLYQTSQSEFIYDLSAVLIHKGTAVNSGHYVAHIRDENTGQWWEFDDEHVSKLGLHPFGGMPTSNSTNGTQSSKSGDSSTQSIKAASNGSHSSVDLQESSESCSGNKAGIFSSTDAYMLMYNRRQSQKVVGENHMALGSINLDSESGIVSLDELVSQLPHLFEEIKETNASYLDACKKYTENTEREKNRITERRQEVRSVLSEAPVQIHSEPYFWISTDWLRQWADSITSTAVDNTAIQCSHSKVPVSKIGIMKRLSAEAWAKLLSKYDGGPSLSSKDYCMDCLTDLARSYISADSYKHRRTLMKELAKDVFAGKHPDGQYYVSKLWLQQWVKRKILDAPCEADVGPTASIRCPHGYLLPEQAAGAKRTLIPENLWLFFYGDAATLKPDDTSGYSAFRYDSDQCPTCSSELSEVACLEDSLRMAKLEQRQNHEKLAGAKNVPLSLNCKYYLLPSSWISNWRTYINASGKNISSSMEPENLDAVVTSLKCEKHSRLLERPPELVNKRGSIFQKTSSTDGLTVISENDWKGFCEEWGCAEEKGVSVIIEFSSNTRNYLAGSNEGVPVHIEDHSPCGEANDEADAVRPVTKTCPEICEECIGERESFELVRKLDYSNEDICIYLVRGKNPPKSLLDPSITTSDPDRRTSKRSKRTGSGDLINVKVSGSTSVYQLKMMIWEQLGIVKENQILHKGSVVIDNEKATLADMNIFPGDKLWVTDSEIHENRDIADALADEQVDIQQAEEGFRGTLLTSGLSSQV